MPMTSKLRVIVFFALNPEMSLSTDEMVRKFGIARQTLLNQCDELAEDGIITLVRRPRTGAPGTTPLVWSAGPTLLEEI